MIRGELLKMTESSLAMRSMMIEVARMTAGMTAEIATDTLLNEILYGLCTDLMTKLILEMIIVSILTSRIVITASNDYINLTRMIRRRTITRIARRIGTRR